MWIYSSTTAGAAYSSAASITSSGSTSSSSRAADTAVTLLENMSATESAVTYISPSGTREVNELGYTIVDLSNGSPIGSITGSSRYDISNGFTSSTTGYTTEQHGGVNTTSTASTISTAVRTRDTYHSTTETTTQAITQSTLTILTVTRSVFTSSTTDTSYAVGTATAATTRKTIGTTSISDTQFATGAGSATITTTHYATGASASLTGPVGFIAITAAEVTEQLWEITATSGAGNLSAVGSTIAGRTATLGTSSRALPVSQTATFTTTYDYQEPLTNATSTLTTTTTLTTADTYWPDSSLYPATSSATRTATVLSTSTTSFTVPSWVTRTYTQTGQAALRYTSLTPWSTIFSSLVPIAANVSPTATEVKSFHVTWRSMTALHFFHSIDQATSASSTTSASTATGATHTTTTGGGTTTRTDIAGTTTTVTRTTALTYTGGTSESQSDTIDTFYESGSTTESSRDFFTIDEGGFFVPGFNDQFTTVYTAISSVATSSGITHLEGTLGTISSSIGQTISTTESSSYFSQQYTIPGAFPEFVSSTDDSWSFTDLTSFSYTQSETLTTEVTYGGVTTTTEESSVSTTGTATTTQTTTAGAGGGTNNSGSSFIHIQGISYTFPTLYPQAALDASASWTAHAMHPGQGFRDPDELASTDVLYARLSAVGASLHYPYAATQDGSSGPVTPIIYTDAHTYSTGSSVYTAFRDSLSRINFTVGVTTQRTATERAPAGTTGTVTKSYTLTTNTSSRTASIIGDSEMTWFAPRSSATESLASRIGGLPNASEFRALIYIMPGVYHMTRQTDGTSSNSATSWITAPELVTAGSASNVGYAFPDHRETVRSCSVDETTWRFDSVLSIGQSTGLVVRPLVTASLNPNL